MRPSPAMPPDIPEQLLCALRDARHVIVLTGAGVSAESGIPTFRDAMAGLWERFEAENLATPSAFRNDPELVWGWYEWRRMQVMQAEPNPAHLAIVKIALHVPRLTLITQNVDDLHERAGSSTPIHLHGSLFHPRCFACARPYTLPPGTPREPTNGRRVAPPKCSHCGGRVRPGVVWFGESLPDHAWRAVTKALEQDCDVLLSIGTSSLVYPAASIPTQACEHGALVVQINPAATELDEIASFNLRGRAGEVLPALVQATWKD